MIAREKKLSLFLEGEFFNTFNSINNKKKYFEHNTLSNMLFKIHCMLP